jgi:hypothetical protein
VKSAREETTSSPEEKRQIAVQISLWFSLVNEGIGGGGLLYHECSLSQVTLESLVKGIKWQGKPKRKFSTLGPEKERKESKP